MSYISQKTYRFLERNRSSNTISPEPTTFEFEESDFWDSPSSEKIKKPVLPTSRSSKKLVKKKILMDRNENGGARSLPVNIPEWSKMRYDDEDSDTENDQEGDEVRQPPHEYLLAREMVRNQNQIACSFSVHEGRGRTLKGRDLRSVRNAIWEQTGFQD